MTLASGFMEVHDFVCICVHCKATETQFAFPIQKERLEQEKRLLEKLIAENREIECNERVAEYNKRKSLREAIEKQVASDPTLQCSDFEAERKRCEEVVAKELADIKAEKEAAWRRKQELKASNLETLARRQKETSERRQSELDFEKNKLKESDALFEAQDALRKRPYKVVKELCKKQASPKLSVEVAATNLVEVLCAEENGLANRATKASQEARIGREILLSVQEADEIFNEPVQRTKEQLDYRTSLNRIREFKEAMARDEKERQRQADLHYLAASEREEATLKKRDEFRRLAGLEVGKCLREQISAKEREIRLQRQSDIEADKKRDAERQKHDDAVEAEKQKLLTAFEAWRSNFSLFPASETVEDLRQKIQCRKDLATSHWITETHENFATWHSGESLDPLGPKRASKLI
ncbi:unnamed protein product [Mesocestoides corti]|uniref:Trichohyalin-plectin-homology domain-containing protein n=3 Tax=Mesocestoides corti TaxID=53468 RepID=A0A0R3UEX1_MESCO|nr:unnamed protein product [Mesocestoides corti]